VVAQCSCDVHRVGGGGQPPAALPAPATSSPEKTPGPKDSAKVPESKISKPKNKGKKKLRRRTTAAPNQ